MLYYTGVVQKNNKYIHLVGLMHMLILRSHAA